jgi:two-component system alkaline phosphatase synthesis response regulator PhoP
MKRILVIDDEPAITRLIKLNLEATGNYQVFTENLGGRAIAAARQFAPDLILLDIMMPDMLGSDVAEKFQQEPDLRDSKIVFLTAMLRKGEVGESQNVGGQRIVAKPISTEELIQVIEETLA